MMRAKLRELYMRSTSLSCVGEGSPAYTRALYAVWSKVYDASIAVDPAYRRNAGRLVDATVRPGDSVIDVGFGTGLLAERGAARARRWLGVDYSGEMLARGARKMAALRLDNVSLAWGDALALRHEDATFDVALSSFMLPHIGRPQRTSAIAEMVRVVRPGGRVGLFLARGEVAPLFPTRGELEDHLAGGGVTEPDIEETDDVYRIAWGVVPG